MMHHQISKPSPRGKPITNKMYLSLKLFSIARLEVTEVTHLTIVTKITVISALMHFALLRSSTHSFNRCGLWFSMLPAATTINWQGTQSWLCDKLSSWHNGHILSALCRDHFTWPNMTVFQLTFFITPIPSTHHPHTRTHFFITIWYYDHPSPYALLDRLSIWEQVSFQAEPF